MREKNGERNERREADNREERRERQLRRGGFLLLFFLLLLLFLLNLGTGSISIDPEELLRALCSEGEAQAIKIVWGIRLPRILAAVFLGGGLAVSGFLLQTFFANPIAGPYILGISSGAKLSVALVMVFALSRGAALSALFMVSAAFAGSMLSLALILPAAGRLRGSSMLLVCGVMVGYLCSAATEFVVTFAEDTNIVNLHSWSQGSFSGVSMEAVRFFAPAVMLLMLLCLLLSKPIGAYQLGERYAAAVGVDIPRLRTALILLSSLFSALVTACAGPVSFVGVAVPQLMKALFRTIRPQVMLPACFLGGAVFCLLADLLARTALAPTELNLGAVTSVMGAPVVIWMMMKRSAA